MKQYLYLTTYNKDYVKRNIKRTLPNSRGQEFTDPIGEGHKEYLLLHKAKITPPSEDGEIYLKKLKQEHRKVGDTYFKKPLEADVIVRYKVSEEVTSEYHSNYCDIEKEIALFKEGRKKEIHLPDDAIIPLTTQRTHFKNPALYDPEILEPPLVIIPATTLKPEDEHIREILNVKTGLTEYMGVIGYLGGVIVEGTKKNRAKVCAKKE
ncbi:hypothetical protein BDFB_007596 [Asbolus verrucosus]|uniref:Uncharacterized protein n=1 Tax=Asbolus verrucosus TaxID=1661398 RepID=A0A482VTC8_ASBVE|nr:hypothetical protein BDFB_007596 [Asbolus verrucosus]